MLGEPLGIGLQREIQTPVRLRHRAACCTGGRPAGTGAHRLAVWPGGISPELGQSCLLYLGLGADEGTPQLIQMLINVVNDLFRLGPLHGKASLIT